MKNILSQLVLVIVSLTIISCSKEKATFDASGSFEAEETIVSSEAQGILKNFKIEEGQILKLNQNVGQIEDEQLSLKKKQLEAQIEAILGRKPEIEVQLASLQEQLKTAQTEKTRINNLLKENAVPTKQLDDVNAQIKVLESQIKAQNSSLTIASKSIDKEIVPLQVQIEQINISINKTNLINPISGTVLSKYSKTHEIVSIGKPLYKIADLSEMILRCFVTGDQLAQIKLNQEVKVFTDDGNGGMKETVGKISWISDKAEFTPKTIQTKDERANLVYAIKIKVKNDGVYKIGMYGEIQF